MLKPFVCLVFLFLCDVVLGTPDYKYNRDVKGWLKLYRVPATFEGAFLTCHDDGAVLASPLTVDLADALSLLMRQSEVNRSIFLGVNSLTSAGTFLSIEGVPLDDMPVTWGAYGDARRPEECLTLSPDNKVYIATCQQFLPYICYKKYDSDLRLNECGTFDNNYKYKDATGSCYKVHRGAMTPWIQAHRTCVMEGGHLVVLNDAKEKDMVLDLVLETTTNNRTQRTEKMVHVGLKRWFYSLWLTVTGDDIENVYNKWVHGQPDLKGTCVGMLRDGSLEDYSCGISMEFVCEKNPKTSRFERVSAPEEYKRESVSIVQYTTTESDPFYVTQLIQEEA